MMMTVAATGGTIDDRIRATVGAGGLRAVQARTGPPPGLPTDTAPGSPPSSPK
ncbi:hypothetical protein ACFWJT_29870 [Streptomyces sp. NPDC127069]|uniref:hypothetical protein n=1 Tax=Streptomyces sp. NPDC127069 TaxID=3347128 RepID=UPI0036519011